jgi:undecaprenyl diphosphate synthase
VRRTVRASRRLGIRALTLYAFSEQNWARPGDEVDALMELLREFLVSEHDEILLNGIRLNAVGNVSRLPFDVRSVLDPLREESRNNGDMTLTLALSYGGREEIAHAAQELAREVAAGRMRPEDVTVDALHARIPSVAVAGDPDLIIRTGGERRISNFLLFGSAYSELFFTDALWPDFTAEHLYTAIGSYQARERRYGLVGKAAELELAPPPVEAPAPKEGAKVIRLAI